MRGSDFQNLPITFMIPRPVLALVIIGLLAIAGVVGLGAWWVMSHLQWVP